MSSVPEPYPPRERAARRTRALLEEMLDRSPDVLVIQSHTPLVADDVPLLLALKDRCRVRVNITVETDVEMLPSGIFPRHMYSPARRIAALAAVRAAGITSVAVVSPLLPLAEPRRFAEALEHACDQVILDHYLVGDGSPRAFRTRRSGFPTLLVKAGYARWTCAGVLWEMVGLFREVF